MYAVLIASSEPPTPAKAAETPNAATLYGGAVDAGGGGGELTVPDGPQRPAEARVEQPPRHEEQDDADRPRQRVQPLVVREVLPEDRHAAPWPVSCGLPKNEIPVEPPVK